MATLQTQIENKMKEIHSLMMKNYNNSKASIAELRSFFEVSDIEFAIAYNSISNQSLLNRFE